MTSLCKAVSLLAETALPNPFLKSGLTACTGSHYKWLMTSLAYAVGRWAQCMYDLEVLLGRYPVYM